MSKTFLLLREDGTIALSLSPAKDRWLLGNGADADLLASEELQLQREEAGITATALGLAKHNGQEIANKVHLEDGDALTIGQETFFFQDGSLAAAALNSIPAGVRWVLKVIAGPNLGAEMPVAKDVSIGSDPSCDVILSDLSVAARHAKLSLGDNPKLIPLASVIYQGKRIDGQVSLEHGSQIGLGTTSLALIDKEVLQMPFTWKEKKWQFPNRWAIAIFALLLLGSLAIGKGKQETTPRGTDRYPAPAFPSHRLSATRGRTPSRRDISQPKPIAKSSSTSWRRFRKSPRLAIA